MNLTEEQKKNEALDLLEATRPIVISAAKTIAYEIAIKNGRVTSTEVLEKLRSNGHNPDIFDKRFMGAVFRKGWIRIGYEESGSHKRPVSVWTLS